MAVRKGEDVRKVLQNSSSVAYSDSASGVNLSKILFPRHDPVFRCCREQEPTSCRSPGLFDYLASPEADAAIKDSGLTPLPHAAS